MSIRKYQNGSHLFGWFSLFPKSCRLRSASFGLDSARLSVLLHGIVLTGSARVGRGRLDCSFGNSGNLHEIKMFVKV